MSFSVPLNALVAVIDGTQATFFTNTDPAAITLKNAEPFSPDSTDHRGAPPLPPETSPQEKSEAEFASHIVDELYRRVQTGNVSALVLIADPQTLGQIRPDLHEAVTKCITGELAKTLTNASVEEIEKSLLTAVDESGGR